MSANNFLKLLQESGMLDESVIAGIRKQIADKKPSAEALAKALVEKGYLTKFQATKLVGEATAGSAPEAAEAETETPQEAAAKDPNDDLGLAPLGDDEEEEAEDAPAGSSGSSSKDDVVMLEEAGDSLTPVEDAGAGLTPVGAPAGLTPLESESQSSGLDAIADDSADPFGEVASQPTATIPRRTRVKKNVWETKLMFGGGLALLLLIVFGAVLYVSLSSTPPLKMWEAAMEDYRAESYSQAQAKFEEYLDDYPEEVNASEARVRIVLCRIRTVLSDPQKGLERANELIPTIEEEETFSVARDELATILIQIPQGFIDRAKKSDDMATKEELVAKAESGMELVTNPSYVPSSRRSAIQNDITQVNEDINLVKRDIDQDRDLKRAIADIGSAAGANDTTAAYEIYKALLKKYPGLARDQGLLEAVTQVTEKERALVTVNAESLESNAEEAPRPSEFRVVLASRSGEGISRLQNQVAVFQAGGSVYGLDAGNGNVIWSRFVGAETRANPVPISSQADADLLIADGKRHDLLRVNRQTGEVVWRLPIGESFSEPVPSGSKIFVATVSGKLREVDVETGNSPRYASIPQSLTVAPSVAPNRPLLFQVGQHSNVYILSAETLECIDVFYLGHRESTVAVPPLVHLGNVFLAHNAGHDFSFLQVLSVNDESEASTIEPAQTPIRLRGNVIVPLQLYGRRVMVVTDLGAVDVFDIDINKEEPAGKAASLAAPRQDGLQAFPLTDAGSLWIADDRLTKYRVQVTTKQINREEITNMGETFVAPLQLFGDVLVYAARPKRSAGIEVAAIHIDQPRKKLWTTQVGVPAGRVSVDETSKAIRVISAAAALFEIDRAALQSGYNNEPVTTARSGSGVLSFTEQIELQNGGVAFFNPGEPGELLVFSPANGGGQLRVVNLELPAGEVTATPVAFQNGLLVPTSSGDVALLDPQTGKAIAQPFRPRLEPGETIQWQRPAVLGDGTEFVLTDDRGTLYRLGIKDAPQPHLAELASNQVDTPIGSALAAVGDTVYGVTRGSGTDVLLALEVGELKLATEFDLQGARVTWGPHRIGERVLLVTDNKQVHCFATGQKSCWEKPAPAYGEPAGPPLLDGEDYIFASFEGAVWRLAGATGQEQKKSEIGEPLAAGPVAFGTRLLLSGNDGAVHVIAMLSGS